jgi:hypothetical protein
MRISAVFGLNQIVSHGFGLLLFAALVPLMRESIGVLGTEPNKLISSLQRIVIMMESESYDIENVE